MRRVPFERRESDELRRKAVRGRAYNPAILAIDLETGKIVWTAQVTPGDVFNGGCSNARNCPGPDFDFGSSVVLETLPTGKDILLAGQKSGMVYGLDPDAQGKVLWKTRVGKGGTNGGVQWGMASEFRDEPTRCSKRSSCLRAQRALAVARRRA